MVTEMPSADGILGALTALVLAIGGGVLRLLVVVARTETMLRAHMSDRHAHRR